MRTRFANFALPIFSLFRRSTTYQADYSDAAEMVHAAVALRVQGCEVRMCTESRRLFITIPGRNRLKMRLALVEGAR